MEWVQEDNPKFTSEMYLDLSITLQALRLQFFNEQKRLTAINKDWMDLVEAPPTSWFIDDDIEMINHKVIQNSETLEAFETGLGSKLSLFSNETE